MTTITNPILNSPFREPTRHFRFDEDGITAEIEEGRRLSTYFVPIPRPKKKGGQLVPGHPGRLGRRTDEGERLHQRHPPLRRPVPALRTTRASPRPPASCSATGAIQTAQKPLFFCQIEALETAIFLLEVAQHREPWIEARLRGVQRHPQSRACTASRCKMATGSGKTVVMAMIIAWQTLNKLANPQDKRFSDTFLVVTPGITIRDRLRVLLPNDPGNYYAERDLVTPDQLQPLQAGEHPGHQLPRLHRPRDAPGIDD